MKTKNLQSKCLSALSVLGLMLSLAITPITAHSLERIAVFAGGCFWCMEEAYEKVPGVTKVLSGYSGGRTKNPTYEKVTYGNTGHYEAVRVHYDDTKVTYAELLEVFWRNIDPLDDGGQFCDRGTSYKSAIFYLDKEQRELAEASLKTATAELKEELQQSKKKKLVTPILSFNEFYVAESYHQDYYKTNPTRYKYYKYACGRPGRLNQLWGDAS